MHLPRGSFERDSTTNEALTTLLVEVGDDVIQGGTCHWPVLPGNFDTRLDSH
ncbi:hypothetical protein D3C76_1446480 [compost metagenome]